MIVIIHSCFSEFDNTVLSFFLLVFEDSVYIQTTASNFLALLCFKMTFFVLIDSGLGR